MLCDLSERFTPIAFLISLSAGLLAAAASLSDEPAATAPNTVYWDGVHLAAIRAAISQDDPQYREVLKRLRKNAEISVKRGPYSVMDKEDVAPSGDKHDYLSYARYWWPNPDTKDGLPYVRRDGRTNEDLLARGDRVPIGKLYDDLETLALAGYLFSEDRYAEHAAKLVRTWFLDPATKMNPHLRFGQAVPGKNEGRGAGIIDTRHFIRVLDSVALLQQTNAWTVEDHAALAAWMKEYLTWLQNDPMGKDEASEKNNHGTWYDAQVAAIAMFVGEQALARQIIENAKTTRIAACIEPDGQQPEELSRSKGLHYSIFNMSAMAVLARIGEQLTIDLWSYESEDERSLRRGLDFVLPYLSGEKEWPHEQIDEVDVSPSEMGLFYLAAARYEEPKYLQAIDGFRERPRKFDYSRLQFPAK
ncbi:MAG TPA: alginate lyase family protein [Lacipirellulaceae bacterium]|nr:alginate lyase family protein [Lacipirellulaceae bacterium]